MISPFLLLLLLPQLLAQSQVTLTQPPLIETNTYTLRKNSTNITAFSTNISYMQAYTDAPLVFTSIVSMYSFTTGSALSFTIAIDTITHTYFTVTYSISCQVGGVTFCSFSEIVIDYLAYDFDTYPFVQILQESLLLDPSALITNQYYVIQYMQPLTVGSSYSINCMLSGFEGMLVLGQPELYINTIFNDGNSYYFNVRFNRITLTTVHFVRILIDQTTMNAMNTGLSSLTCSIGTIQHSSDPNVVERNPTPDFLPFAVFFGASGFGEWNIQLQKLSYIFNNTTPRMQANIGYILFLTASCPANQLYVSTENLCYSLSSAFYYQATPATMQPCPYSCYQCVGPLTTQCRSCVQGWNRVLSGGRCVCISGFYDPGAPQCKNCTLAIDGCKTCSSATNCLTCLSGCTAIGFSPIYCDCPANVQQNYSFNCPSSYYFDYSANLCACRPQTYYNSIYKLCLPCDTGCYICTKSYNYCLSCVDSYALINNTCVFFYTSYKLLGQMSSYNNPVIRCLRWDNTYTNCLQKCKYYYYQSNCYMKCPLGTFNISFPWLTCQPCQLSCNYCYNYTICFQCSSSYYYFNTTILSCSPCSPHCVKCANASHCTLCESMYALVNFSCALPAIASPVCSDNCSFCLLSNQCLKCNVPYYLNLSSQICLQCRAQFGLQLWSDGCHEICGDGKLINSECDDGNTLSGDGCSSTCKIQPNFQCREINGISYCWSRIITLSWDIFSIFGTNQLIVSLYSPNYNLAHSIVTLQCGFGSYVVSSAIVGSRLELALKYNESVVLMQVSSSDGRSSALLAGNLTLRTCWMAVNGQQNYTLSISHSPSLLFVDFNSTLESINNGNSIKFFDKAAMYLSLVTFVFPIAPLASYSCLRIYNLLFTSYLDYRHVPINAFAPYQAIQSLYFLPASTTTKDLSLFSSDYLTTILWHLIVVYIGFAVWMEWGASFVLKVCRSMDLRMLNKMFTCICEGKAIGYHNMYLSFEVAILCIAVQVFANIDKSSAGLVVLVCAHLIFYIASKVHFWFTFQQLGKAYPQFTHTLVVQQVQNISIAALFMLTTSKGSYVALLMSLFAVYPLISLGQNNPSPLKASQSRISTQITIWQLRISCVFQLVIQLLKVAYMWCGNLPFSLNSYESIGTSLGLVIGLLTSVLILAGSLSSLLIHAIRMCQLKSEGKSVLPSSEQVDMESVDASSHAQ